MDPVYARNYRELYDSHWWWRARESFILKALRDLEPQGSWGRILDVGCGDGLFFEALSSFGQVEGIEPDPKALTSGCSWRDRIYVQPFDRAFRSEKAYGLVLMLDVLEHLQNPHEALEVAFSLLEPGGMIVLTVPAFLSLWTSHDDLNRHQTRYTVRRLRDVVERAGGRVRTSRYFFQWTTLPKLAAHVKEKIFPIAASTPRIPPPWLNRAMLALSLSEQKVLGPLRVPFGSSILLAAEKATSSSADGVSVSAAPRSSVRR